MVLVSQHAVQQMASASPQHQHIQGITAGSNAVVLAGTFNSCSFDHVDIATRRAKVLDDLRLTDPFHDRAELQSEKGRRLPGTCTWIQTHPVYRNWLQGDCEQLWISGGPGMGKTMLSIFITESLEESGERVTYFFCRHDDEKRNTETAVLRGLLVQLLRGISDESFDQHVWPSFHSDKAASYTLSKPQAIWDVFETLVMSPDSPPTFCILDGLDECDRESSRKLTQRFYYIFGMNKATRPTHIFKLAVLSRDQSGLRGFSNLRLQECDSHIRHDIERFIASSIQDSLSHKPDFDGWIKLISDELLYRSEGSFLWISFVVRDLTRYRTSREVIKALKCIPQGLEEQYRRILRHISEDHDEDWREIQALLTWTALAFVPLTVSQLARAVMGSVTREHRERIKDLSIYCEHLLVINDETGVVRFVHTSVKEFLAQRHPMISTVSVTDRTHIDKGNQIIMRMCLKILERTAESDVLRPYAVEFLPRHMEACTAADISHELSRPYFTVENILQNHWGEWRLKNDLGFFQEATPSPLHIATYWGVIPWAQHQLQARSIWDILPWRNPLESKDAYGLTPLAIAVWKRNMPMVEWLLQQGAIVHLDEAIPEDAEEHLPGKTRGLA
ncbi:ankyrin repeat protein [Apiospora marii]|uniref:Ankyrin repeat protein n=1 Tax=Apiospora marii TaxID=335849 RepID=A0ABR1RIB7_9PEZI